MSLRLSIIIPFYNVEQYIAECLDSVFNQDIPLSEYEVICVNDGSPDSSRDIVLDYMRRFPNLRLIEHEKNKKLGAARNTGRSIAKGRYIWNVDSDDKIVPNCLSEMLGVCEENKLDILEFGTIRFNKDGEESKMPQSPQTQKVMTGLDYLEGLNSYQVSRLCPVWKKMIRKTFLEENGVSSPEINMGEDIPYSFRALMLAERVFVSPACFYLYRANDNSLTGRNWKPSAEVLYEKCFVNPKLVYNIANEVQPAYSSVMISFLESAKYTLSLFTRYFGQMSEENRVRFKSLCRQSFFDNSFVLRLMGKRQFICYLLWLVGLKSMPS